MIRGFSERMALRVDPSSLAAFRFGYGIVIEWMMFDHLRPQPSGKSWLHQLFDATPSPFYFSYPYLAWWKPTHLETMEWVAWICAIASLSLAVGMMTRVSAGISFLSFAYLMTSDAHLYGNHIALALVYSFLLIGMPTGAVLSVDAWLAKRFWPPDASIPFTSVFLLRFQTGVIYFFGGVAKIHTDWLGGEPMQSWFRGGTTAEMMRATLGPGVADSLLIPLLARHETALFFSWGGLVFDLAITFLLLARRTRIFALALALFFHTFNFFFVHNVGLVAVMALWATFIFCEPDWPRKFLRWLAQPSIRPPDIAWFTAGMFLIPVAGALLGWKSPISGWRGAGQPVSTNTWGAAVLWMMLAVLIPCRHFVIPGDVLFTAEGTAFSWFLMTCNKEGEFVRFEVVDPHVVAPPDGWTIVDTSPTDYAADGPSAVADRPTEKTFVVFDPLLGQRLFHSAANPEEVRSFANEWRSSYGRTPKLVHTLPLQEVLNSIQKKHADETSGPAQNRLGVRAANALSLLEQMNRTDQMSSERRTNYYLLLYQLTHLATELSVDPEQAQQLRRVGPWQGQPTPPSVDTDVYLVEDAAIMLPARRPLFTRIDASKWKGPKRLYCHLDFLPHEYFEYLGHISPIERGGVRTSYLWNDVEELNAHQVKALGYFPYLIQQYARHVADEWYLLQGRYPEIRATSYLWLNQHGFQPLVDSKVDLSRETYRLLAHNRWIQDYERRPVPK